MKQPKVGQVVWHDLFTSDRACSMAFNEQVANWTYQVERARDFAWGGGEKDFVLALSGDEAGAGFAETPSEHENGWIACIEDPDVVADLSSGDEQAERPALAVVDGVQPGVHAAFRAASLSGHCCAMHCRAVVSQKRSDTSTAQFSSRQSRRQAEINGS